MKALCETALKAVFGNACKLQFLELISDTCKSYTYKVKGDSCAVPLFLKVEKPEIGLTFQKDQIKKEIAGLTLCREHQIPVPKILGKNTDCQTPWILTEFLEGKLLSEYTLSNENEVVVAREFEELYGHITEVESEFYGDTYFGGSVGQFPTWKEAIYKTTTILFEDLLKVTELGQCADIVYSAILKAVQNVSNNIKAVLFHQDLHAANLFAVEKDDGLVHISAVIDFGMSSFSDVAYSQFITRKYSPYLKTQPDYFHNLGIDKETLSAYEILNFEPVVLTNYFILDNREQVTNAFVERCRLYLGENA